MKPALVILLLALLAASYWYIVRPWYLNWGATAEEQAASLPGDELSPARDSVSTRAITVRAPADQVYPWLVQVGQGRGGMYSYEWLENIAGCDIHNVYQILPELQHIQTGQIIKMGPEGYPFYRVHGFEPGRYLVLQPGDPATKQPGDAAWTLYLQDRGDGTTRLIARQQMRVGSGFGAAIMWRGLIDPMSFLMEQKMLRTIRNLAEGR